MSSHKKLHKRDLHRPLGISVVVPCAHSHVQHLPDLVAAFQAQTRKPDQIVVAISGCAASALPRLDAEVIHSPDRQTAGRNRNRGSSASRGDVIIYQDADDLPHPQRVEIIAGLFETYQIDHLMHFYDRSAEQAHELSFKKASKRTSYRKKASGGVTNGNPAIARSLFELVQWPERPGVGEDTAFNAAVYTCTKLTAVMELSLLTYRQHLSSFQ